MPADTLTVAGRCELRDAAQLWDEFHPRLYDVSVTWHDGDPSFDDDRTLRTGLREFRVDGTRFAVNGRPVFLRGTLDWVLFPLTGYPGMGDADWDRLFGVIRSYGMNHVRFHSWCPPEAAFAAADRLGLYLQLECWTWCRVGDGKPIDQWLYDESERIVGAYGNHPSFCMMAHGNEPSGPNLARLRLACSMFSQKRRDTSGRGVDSGRCAPLDIPWGNAIGIGRVIVRADRGGNIALGFSSIFWNTAWTGGPRRVNFCTALCHMLPDPGCIRRAVSILLVSRRFSTFNDPLSCLRPRHFCNFSPFFCRLEESA